MFDHVTLRVSDLEASRRFYSTVLSAIGVVPTHRGPELVEWQDFGISPAGPSHPATQGLHAGFVARSRGAVRAFWQAGVDAGHRDDGAPGERPQYGPAHYGGFLRDPDGNSAEAVHSPPPAENVNVDHLWLRVVDAEASARFYALVGRFAGFQRDERAADRPMFRRGHATFTVLADEPRTRHLHLAFPSAGGAEGVRAFHRAALEAGHRDNGAPGERPQYHPGYYAAYVLDPDGFNVEVVEHHR